MHVYINIYINKNAEVSMTSLQSESTVLSHADTKTVSHSRCIKQK